MTTKPKSEHRVVSKLLDSTARGRDSVSACVVGTDAGTRWLRIERRSHDGRDYSIDLPLRIAGSLGVALCQFVDREAAEQ
jgi:hypothetical protein